MPLKPSFTLVIMGVSGSGKSTVARLVAERTGSLFLDADDFHTATNRTIMAEGKPLRDEDREPWLSAIREEISHRNAAGETVVLACSALKENYRQQLRAAGPQVVFVHLHGTRDQLTNRLKQRSDHFFPSSLLDSQLADLEPPNDALTLDISATPNDLATQILVPFFNRLP